VVEAGACFDAFMVVPFIGEEKRDTTSADPLGTPQSGVPREVSKQVASSVKLPWRVDER